MSMVAKDGIGHGKGRREKHGRGNLQAHQPIHRVQPCPFHILLQPMHMIIDSRRKN